jgi:molybdenum cofactor cytidylyltransferase
VARDVEVDLRQRAIAFRTEVSVAGIILAAGESRRMGRPKALLPFRGGTFVSVLAETLGEFCSPVYAVFGFEAERMVTQTPPSVVAVENPNYQQGMLTSLQAGLRAMNQLPDRVLFTLVDHPAVGADTVRQLLRHDAALVIPRYAGKRGHPVIISREIALEALAEPATSKLNNVVDRHAAEIRYVDVDDAGVRDDIDDPGLYQELLAREDTGV